MDKLEYLLKTAFGRPEAEREPQRPNEFTMERQREFEATAKKVAALRQLRLERFPTQQQRTGGETRPS
jgi:hypothetical protein